MEMEIRLLRFMISSFNVVNAPVKQMVNNKAEEGLVRLAKPIKPRT